MLTIAIKLTWLKQRVFEELEIHSVCFGVFEIIVDFLNIDIGLLLH